MSEEQKHQISFKATEKAKENLKVVCERYGVKQVDLLNYVFERLLLPENLDMCRDEIEALNPNFQARRVRRIAERLAELPHASIEKLLKTVDV